MIFLNGFEVEKDRKMKRRKHGVHEAKGMRELPPDVKAFITPNQSLCQRGDRGEHAGDTQGR